MFVRRRVGLLPLFQCQESQYALHLPPLGEGGLGREQLSLVLLREQGEKPGQDSRQEISMIEASRYIPCSHWRECPCANSLY